MAKQNSFDFIVVGLGPSGLLATAYLAKQGYSVAAVERHEQLYSLPRAGHVDHEIVRYLQELGVADMFLEDAYPTESYTWYNGQGQVLLNVFASSQSISGFASDYMMYQPRLDDALLRAIDGAPVKPAMYRGYQLTGFTQDESGVSIEIQRRHAQAEDGTAELGESMRLRCAYLLASDGARSSVRQKLGIEQNDLGFNETWLDVDVRLKRPIPEREPHQVCDPRRPIYIGPLGRSHHRWEWAILPGETHSDFTRPEKAWQLLSEQNITQDDVEIVRQQIYTFEARVARQWRQGRVFLVGDAAHSMPPFMGQGACSGLRDAVNLAWKLDLVMQGLVSDAILDAYQAERKPHTERWIEISMRTGAVSCTLDPERAAERDAQLLNGTAPPLPDFPILTSGVLDMSNGTPATQLSGTLFPQRELERGQERGLFDDIAGRGFVLVTNSEHVCPPGWDGETLLARLGGRLIVLSADQDAGRIVDVTGFYQTWFEEHGIVAVLTRPDFVIFGVARSPADTIRMVAQLGQALSMKSSLVREPVLG